MNQNISQDEENLSFTLSSVRNKQLRNYLRVCVCIYIIFTNMKKIRLSNFIFSFSDSIGKGQQSAMLDRLLGKGSYASYDMRCMVTGQFSAGKSTLVKLLAGDVIPEGRHPTDGISLIEGRCGLDIDTREWILVDPGKKTQK